MSIQTGSNVVQEEWTDMTAGLSGSFTAHATTPKFFKDNNGFVHLTGKVVKAAPAAGDTIYTLPAGYRPAQAMSIPAVSNVGAADVAGGLLIGTDGTVKYQFGGASTFIALDNVRFRAGF